MAHAAHKEEHHGHHIIPAKILLKVFGALVALTVITVLTAQVDLGPLNVPVALAIALTKATLVVAYFMALKYDKRVNTLVFSMGVLFVIVFLVFTLFDTAFRGDFDNADPQTIQDIERAEEALRARQANQGAVAPAPEGAEATGEEAGTAGEGTSSPEGGQAADH